MLEMTEIVVPVGGGSSAEGVYYSLRLVLLVLLRRGWGWQLLRWSTTTTTTSTAWGITRTLSPHLQRPAAPAIEGKEMRRDEEVSILLVDTLIVIITVREG